VLGAAGRAYAVSYNRPLADRGVSGGEGTTNQVFYAEFPMIFWLEENGYNVSYFTGIDAARYGSLIPQHQVYLTAGHDEYWSGQQRANVTAARDAGVNLAFFTGNETYWKTRLQNALAGPPTPNRTLVTYKETLGTTGTTSAKIDPLPDVWTGTWRDSSFSPPADGGRPENALGGTIFTVNRGPADGSGTSFLVPALDAQDRIWANTVVAALQPGQVYTSAINLLGYEWDSDLDNGFRPAGLIDLSSETVNVPEMLLNNGSVFGPGTASHSLTLYRADSGALVFGAGTVQWSWALSNDHDGGPSPTDPVIQQATVNLLGEMGAQPATLLAGLVPATPPTNRTPPASAITSVNNGLKVRTGHASTVSGTATDSSGGVVAGVEVSVDGGKTWHPATGHGTWSYTWTPTTPGTITVLSRATDDSGYTEVPGPGVKVTVVPDATTPPQIVNVSAAVVNTQTATITWTTDENATSRVDYGTSPTALTSNASNSALVTAHSITLTGLTPDTVYYFRVTSVDGHSNSTTVPATSGAPSQFATPAFIDTTVTDFSGGQTGANTYIAQMADGEVILAPTVGTEFSGTSLPAGWFSTPWSSGGTAGVSGGLLTVDGANAGTSARYGPGRSLEVTATFSGATFQTVGFGVDFNATPWAAFGTSSGGGLYAETNNGTASSNLLIPGNWFGSPHDFRIDWTSSAVNYSIDGVLVASSPLVITGSMRPLASDLTPGGGVVTVDWMHLTPYAASGTYTSRVFDAGQLVTWTLFNDSIVTPPNTSIALAVRMGNTAAPDGTWTDFIPVSGPGAIIGGASRYLQYQAVLTTTNPGQTPVLQFVALSDNPAAGSDTYPPKVLSITPAASATNVSPSTTVVVKFSELMNAATITASTVQLFPAGSSTPVAATVSYAGSTATLQPTGLLLTNTQYQVVVSGSITDSSGNPLGSNVTSSFTTGLATFTDTTVSDFSAGTTGSGTYVSHTSDGEVILAPLTGSEFLGTSLPSGWFSQSQGSGGSASVPNGTLTVDGALTGPNQFFGPGVSLQFQATFSGDPYQHIGFGTDLSAAPWAIFSTAGGGALYARTNNGTSFVDTLLAGNWLGSPHQFRIDWTTSGVTYFIDGTQVASSTLAITANMRPLVDDNTPGGGVVTVNWLRLAPYAASGTFVSRVFDAGTAVTWSNLTWTANTPAGTGLGMSVRMGNTATPDATWTDWVPLSTSGAAIGGSSRYLQYQAALSTTNTALTPDLDSVTAGYSTTADTVPPTVVSSSPAAGATNVNLITPVVVKFSELMNAATITTSTVQLFAAGSSTPVAASLTFSGSTATLTPTVALQGNTSYQVVVSGSITDSSGNALGSNVTASFTTGSGQWLQTTAADFSAGTQNGTAVTNTAGGEVQLARVFGDEFNGTALGSAWTATPTGGGTASTTVSGGILSVAATEVDSVQTFSNVPVEGSINFGAAPYQHFGLATSLSAVAGNSWAIFSTAGTTNTLFARVNASGTTTDVNLGGLPSGFHDYLIKPVSGGFAFYVDGALQTTITASFPTGTALKVVLSAYNASPVLQADWVHINSYPAGGTFTSSVFDATRAAIWGTVNWDAVLPAGTTITVETRSGSTATPDGTWSAWTPVSNGGTVASPSARYLEYEVIFSTTDPTLTPILDDILFNWS
jgi:hypothetical protein